MKTRLAFSAIGAVLAVAMLTPAAASAATEVGNQCSATSSSSSAVLVSTANAPGNPLPATIPSGGVVTRWSFSIALPFPPGTSLSETLKVFRRTGAPNQFQVVGESSPQSVSSGNQTFNTRIPVQAGDLIGALAAAGGSTGTVYCQTENPGDRVVAIAGTAPLGSTGSGEELPGLQNPVVVFVEADADNDGFGDETQDACPQSAAFQTPCPPVVLSTSTQVKKGSVTVIVTSSTAAPVTVKGVAKLGKGKKAKLNGGTQNLVPGTLSKFKLFFTKGLKNKLKETSPKNKLTLKVTVSGTSVSGAVTTKTLKLKLKGQANG
ncbi:MAG TPA: hypothetical protein VFN92_04300 [Solirubrobacterales bacterium]|nr:hypothetical protein [Solirubrobacterales bacterium]